MTLSKRQRSGLENIIRQAEKILNESGASAKPSANQLKKNPNKSRKRARLVNGSRRSRVAAAELRKEIMAARKKGARVAELAEKHGVTQSYIYQMR
jgi:ElaB/YqjD/DUF883 family membrane-anchored ribosome-binding protein